MAYTWSPDYSSFIDPSQYPGAAWRPATEGGGSEGLQGTPAGWYTGGGYNPDSGGMNPYTSVDAPTTSYWRLRDAGMWDLKDPNSVAWKYLQAMGGGGDVKNDPNALYAALRNAGLGDAALSRDANGRTQVEGAYKEALNGLNPQFVDQFATAAGQNAENYWTTSKQSENQGVLKDIGDSGRVFRDMATQTPLGVALAAMTMGLSGASGLGAGAVDTAGGATGALGTAGAAGGTTALGGLEAGASPFLSGLDSAAIAGADFSGVPLASLGAAGSGLSGMGSLESMLGPATGSVESAPIIGASGAPEIAGVAQGAGAFAPLAGTGANLASLLGPATGTVEAAPVIGAQGLPAVSGVANGAGAFIPPAAAAAAAPSSLADLSASGGATAPAATSGAQMPAAVAETPYDLANQGLPQTGPGQFEQMPMTAGGAGASLGTAGLGAGATIAEGGTAASGGASAGGTAAAAAGGGTALSRLLDGSATTADLLSLGGTGLATGLGVYGANQQTQAYKDLANQYMAMGAPYRQKLSDLYANPSSYLSSSEVQTPVQQGTDAMARALSVRGNPTGSGTALQELQNYSANQLYGRLGEEKNRLAGFGGLTQYNAAAPGAAGAAVGSQGGIYNALGYGLGQLTNPQPTLAQSLNQFRVALGSLT